MGRFKDYIESAYIINDGCKRDFDGFDDCSNDHVGLDHVQMNTTGFMDHDEHMNRI